MFITDYEIAQRLLRRKPRWVHGEPTICLRGTEGKYGILAFDFGDEVVEYNVFLKDKEYILDQATRAVVNFHDFANRYWDEKYELVR